MSAPAPESQQRLQQSRDEIRGILEPVIDRNNDQFPRSATMRLLVGKTGSGLAGALIGAALLRLSPGAGRLLSLLPVTAIARTLIRRRVSSRRTDGNE